MMSDARHLHCLSAATPSAATTNHLNVTAAAAPAWVTGEALTVAITVNNPDAQLLCSPMAVTLKWHGNNGLEHRHTVSEVAVAGVWAGTIRIPAHFVRRGVLHASVSASQLCGLFTAGDAYGGRSRGTMTSRVL
jgi:hypothetical protein